MHRHAEGRRGRAAVARQAAARGTGAFNAMVAVPQGAAAATVARAAVLGSQCRGSRAGAIRQAAAATYIGSTATPRKVVVLSDLVGCRSCPTTLVGGT